MLLQFLVILVALVVLFIVFNSKKEKTSGKALSVFIFILILSICSKTINLERNLFNEGFNVSIPSDNEIENFENNRDSKISNIKELNSESYNNDNSYLDKEEEEFLNSHNKKNNAGKNKNINSVTELDSLLKNKQPLKNNNKKEDEDNFTDNIQSDVKDSNQFSPSINFNFGGDESKDFSLNLKPNKVNDTFKNTDNNDNNDYSNNNDNFNNTNIDGNHNNVKVSNPENANTFDPKIYDNDDDDSFQSIEKMQRDYANTQKKYKNKPQNSYERFQTTPTNTKKEDTRYKYEPGMAYMPPKYWAGYIDDEKVALGILNDVNNFRRQSRCPQPEKDINTRRLPIGIMDPGTPIFAYEVASDGKAPKRERDAQLTNIGSILPKFSYTEYNSEVQYPNDKDLKKNNYYHDYSQNCTPYGLGGQDRRDRIPPANPEDD